MGDGIRDDRGGYYEQVHGSCPNPNRKANRIRRQERMVIIHSEHQERWWLEVESGMLRAEVIQEVLRVRYGRK